MCKDPKKRATLADTIKEKLTEKQTEITTICSGMYNKEYMQVKEIFL